MYELSQNPYSEPNYLMGYFVIPIYNLNLIVSLMILNRDKNCVIPSRITSVYFYLIIRSWLIIAYVSLASILVDKFFYNYF